MALTTRHQAVHDRVTRTTVQIRDIARARPGDARLERPPISALGLPSAARRLVVIVLYLFASMMLYVLTLNLTVRGDCLLRDACSGGEAVWKTAVFMLLLDLMAWAIIRGWQARLVGARRRAV